MISIAVSKGLGRELQALRRKMAWTGRFGYVYCASLLDDGDSLL